MGTIVTGVSASPGLAVGSAYVYATADLTVPDRVADDVIVEVQRVRDAVASATRELVDIKEAVRNELGDDHAHIFRSQQTVVEDESILAEIEDAVRAGPATAESAVEAIFSRYRALFEELDDDDYNKSRAVDIDDVRKRLVRNLLGLPDTSLSGTPDGSIVVARELLPSDTASMNASRVRGIITERGGATSHAAILARSLGIPAAAAVDGAMSAVNTGDTVALDATDESARVYINPSADQRADLATKSERHQARAKRVAQYHGRPPVTPDGFEVTLSANIGGTADIEPARAAGAASVGLYRSEFLFLGASALPDEGHQYSAYRAAAESFAQGFVVVRTLDVGGDKQLPTVRLPDEANPFLGNRGLRLSLARPDFFDTQLRAILRASAHGPVRIMFPMVGGVIELERALERLEVAKRSLDRAGLAYDPEIEVGVMIEVPSAVLVADSLARRVSFFSVGTNDLTQYLLAADRMNEHVTSYYRPHDPAVYRAIAATVDSAERHGRWVGVCGELGGDPVAIPALIGLGVRELSMTARALPEATYTICTTPVSEARDLAARVLEHETATDIRMTLQRYHDDKERQ